MKESKLRFERVSQKDVRVIYGSNDNRVEKLVRVLPEGSYEPCSTQIAPADKAGKTSQK